MRKLFIWPKQTASLDDRVCWREVLEAAMCGIYPSEQQLEHMLDKLERTP